jgi:hypothetical protein
VRGVPTDSSFQRHWQMKEFLGLCMCPDRKMPTCRSQAADRQSTCHEGAAGAAADHVTGVLGMTESEAAAGGMVTGETQCGRLHVLFRQ